MAKSAYKTGGCMARKQTAGLPGLEPACTLAEIAKILGVTTERARQLEVSGLAKARKILEAKGITAEMFLEIFRQPAARAD
jgi:DNA-directed RNA polymerase sigma subunit (sigma70/sigma32)